MIGQTLTVYKDAYAGLSRNTWLLSLVMLINRSGTMVVPFMSLYLTSHGMGYSIGQAGFVYGLFGAGAFAGAWLGGKLTDSIGFYRVQLVTLTGGGLLFILLGQMKTFPGICIVSFMLSFINEAFRPANSTAIAFYSKEENRTRSYSLNRLAINLGWAVGSAIGGLLAKYNYEILFWVDALTNLCAAALMLVFVRPAQAQIQRHLKQLGAATQSALRDKVYVCFIVLATLFATCFFQLFTNLSIYYKLDLHFSEPFIGLLMAVNGLIIVLIEMVVVYKLEGRRKSTVYIITGTLLMAAGYCMLSTIAVTQALAFLLVVVITFAEIMAMPFMNSYWTGRSNAANRGQYAALYTMAWSAAQTFGPMTGAQLAEHGGFKRLWWAITGLSLVTAAGFMGLHRYTVNNEAAMKTSPVTADLVQLEDATEEPIL